MASSSSGQATARARRISIVDVLEGAADRFERRLSEETGKLRVDMARMETRLIAWMFVLWLAQIGALVTLLK
jgi:hypothetical protein